MKQGTALLWEDHPEHLATGVKVECVECGDGGLGSPSPGLLAASPLSQLH